MTCSAPLVAHNTPRVQVFAGRLTVREIVYHRHDRSLERTDQRVTCHGYDRRGVLERSVDPRLAKSGRVNFTFANDLVGRPVRAERADAGICVALADILGRPLVRFSAIAADADGRDDCGQVVVRSLAYETPGSPGRLVSITDTQAGGDPRIVQRFVYGGGSASECASNLAGRCVGRYDGAGLALLEGAALTGTPIAFTRRLLEHGDDEQTTAHWRGETASDWDRALESVEFAYTTCAVVDACAAVSSVTDAAGNRQRVACDIAGHLKAAWLSRKGAPEREIVRSLSYLACGAKASELHGNGVLTQYFHDPTTRRQTGRRIERPAAHARGMKVLQDVRYTFDPVGNLVGELDMTDVASFWRNQKVVPKKTFRYDSLYQLVSASGREHAQGEAAPGMSKGCQVGASDQTLLTCYSRDFTYDAAGNLMRTVHLSPASSRCYVVGMMVSDRSNRAVLDTMASSPAEAQAAFTASGHQAMLLPNQPLLWTSNGELRHVVSVQREQSQQDDSEHYRYDGDSQRITKINTQWASASRRRQRVIYLPGLELRRTVSNARVEEELQILKVGGGGYAQVRLLYWSNAAPPGLQNDQLRYSYDTPLGSSILEIDGDGRLISHEDYYPYGGTAFCLARNKLEANYKTLGHGGKERDVTGLYYYGQRYYQPWAGRWLSADPAGAVDGLNLYCRVRNNPVTRRDDDGLQSFESEFGPDFSALDKVIDFPEIFKAAPEGVVLKGNVSEHSLGRLRLKVYWQREVPAYQPLPSEQVIGALGDDGRGQLGPDAQRARTLGVTEQFAKDLTRSSYTVIEGGQEKPLGEHTIDQLFTRQQKEIVSTLAHQAHAAELAVLSYGIEAAGGTFDEQGQFRASWVQAPGADPEHIIEKPSPSDRSLIVRSRQIFSLKYTETEQLAADLSLTAEQISVLRVDRQGGEITYHYQDAHPTIQKLQISYVTPVAPVSTKRSLASKIKFWRSSSKQ